MIDKIKNKYYATLDKLEAQDEAGVPGAATLLRIIFLLPFIAFAIFWVFFILYPVIVVSVIILLLIAAVGGFTLKAIYDIIRYLTYKGK